MEEREREKKNPFGRQKETIDDKKTSGLGYGRG